MAAVEWIFPKSSWRSGGFSLIELLVVMAILGVLAGLVTARVSSPNEATVLKTESRKLIAHLRATRSKALAESEIYSVMTTDEGKGYAIRPGEEIVILTGAISLELSSTNMPAGLSGSVPSITFYPDGSTSGGTIILSGSNGKREISVNWITGEVAIAPQT